MNNLLISLFPLSLSPLHETIGEIKGLTIDFLFVSLFYSVTIKLYVIRWFSIYLVVE